MNTLTTRIIAATIAGAALLPAAAFAQTLSATANVSAAHITTHASSTDKTGGASIVTIQARADQEIARRLTNLNDLATREAQMKNISANEKASLTASINTQISEMNTLKATIDAQTDITTLKTEVQSITKDYRIYMVVIPQGRITAAADRVETIVADITALAPKLQTRITAAQTAGKDMTAATNAYADMQAKTADANTQAQAAVNEVVNLVPDQGDATVQASNTAALKDAAAKIKTADTDLKAARADITTILNAVKGTGSVTASASAAQ